MQQRFGAQPIPFALVCLFIQLLALSCQHTSPPVALLLDPAWRAPQDLAGPCDLEILPGNKLLVSDSALRAVFVFDENGEELARLSHSSLRKPTALAALSSQEFFAADIAGNSLLRFNLAGELLRRFGDEGNARGLMLRPMGLALAPDSTLWMTEHGNRRVQAFRATPLIFYGATADDSLRAPTGIVAASDGSVYFTDVVAQRVWHLSAEGKVLSRWETADDLRAPSGIALDHFENVFVAGENGVRAFSKSGKMLFISDEHNEGLSPAIALAFDKENRLYVLSANPPRVSRFEVRY
jgi:hypothetical protein